MTVLVIVGIIMGVIIGMGYATYRIAKALLFGSGRLAKKVISKF
jgi:hypothetical protein